MVDILNAEYPNLRMYRRAVHKAILLDEMQGPEFIVANKKVLQMHVDGAELGKSPTNQFAYDVLLWRTPIIITTNNWNLGTLAAIDREWIEGNCVAVEIAEPVWQTTKADSTAQPGGPLGGAKGSKRPLATPEGSPDHMR